MKVCTLCSGSKGNSTYIEINNVKFLFDCGKTLKYITNALELINVNITDINYIFITHDHVDHVSALKNVLKKSNAKLYITKNLYNKLEDISFYTNVSFIDKEVDIDNIIINPLVASHDATESMNYVIGYNNKKISLITDTGYLKAKDFKYYKNSDLFLMESNHDVEMVWNCSYPEFTKKRIISDEGHLSNNQAGYYLTKLIGPNTKKIMLIHLSEENNTPDLALETVKAVLEEHNIKYSNFDYAKQNEISEVMYID